VSQAEAARISAEAALAHNSALQQGEVRSAQQDLSDCQARLADLEATNTLLIQEQQVCLLLIDLKSTWVLARQYF